MTTQNKSLTWRWGSKKTSDGWERWFISARLPGFADAYVRIGCEGKSDAMSKMEDANNGAGSGSVFSMEF